MTTNQALLPCIFCGGYTQEQHTTRIGLIYIHSECLEDLEEILSLTVDEMEAVKI